VNIKIQEKIKLPRFFSRRVTKTKPEAADLSGPKQNRPAERANGKYGIKAANRTLTANMTGQVTLTGNYADLHFQKGSLKKISSSASDLITGLNSRTRFVTSKGIISYRNESAFSFEDYPEYGLRTLQIPQQRRKRDFRVITDFIFGGAHEDCMISVTIDYPVFDEKITVYESAVFETPLFSLTEAKIEITADENHKETVVILPGESKKLFIPGRVFKIRSEYKTFRIAFPHQMKNSQISGIDGLSVKTAQLKGENILFINPGGSYSPAPAGKYSGIREQFCFTIGV